MLEDLRNAQKSINFSAYIWEPGKLSKQISDVLAERAEAGVQVRVLLDGLGGMRAPKEHIEHMKNSGVKVCFDRAANAELASAS